MAPKIRPSDTVLAELYLMWLQGKPLRYLSKHLRKQYGIQAVHGTIAGWFRQVYGEGATDPVAMSFQRSLLEDYEGKPEYETVKAFILSSCLDLRSETQHRSQHSLKQLTLYQTVRDEGILEYMVPTGNDPWDMLEDYDLQVGQGEGTDDDLQEVEDDGRCTTVEIP